MRFKEWDSKWEVGTFPKSHIVSVMHIWKNEILNGKLGHFPRVSCKELNQSPSKDSSCWRSESERNSSLGTFVSISWRCETESPSLEGWTPIKAANCGTCGALCRMENESDKLQLERLAFFWNEPNTLLSSSTGCLGRHIWSVESILSQLSRKWEDVISMHSREYEDPQLFPVLLIISPFQLHIWHHLQNQEILHSQHQTWNSMIPEVPEL